MNQFQSEIDKKFWEIGKLMLSDPHFQEVRKVNVLEEQKSPSRTEIINFLISSFGRDTKYLEIGVRYPSENFNHIQAAQKWSVDPGYEAKENLADFKVTSDEFFEQLSQGRILSKDMKFDVIFIDGLHLAPQVDKDIQNALGYLAEDGFIVLHDCNPPSEWHARYQYHFYYTPAFANWNGTTWKAFLKWRCKPEVYSCCIDTDWGVGILSKQLNIGESITAADEFYEYNQLAEHRKEWLNLQDFESFKKLIQPK